MKQTRDPKYLYGALQGKNAAVEYPVYCYVKELLSEYPDAKFVLTTREGIGWAKSVKENLFRPEDKSKAPVVKCLGLFSDKFDAVGKFGQLFEKHVEQGVFHGNVTDENHMALSMRAHTESMIKLIPTEQLLVLPVELSGHEKLQLLCEFLGKDIPEGMEYPQANRGAAIRQTAERILMGKPFDRTGRSYQLDGQ